MKADPSSVDKASGAGRPRDPRIDAAILTATADLLVQIGYSNLTLAAVAERAGTHEDGAVSPVVEQGRTGARGGVPGGAHGAGGLRQATWRLTYGR